VTIDDIVDTAMNFKTDSSAQAGTAIHAT
jgi:hypothetical protein